MMRLDHRVARGADQLVNSASSALFTFGAVLLLTPRLFGGVSLQLIAMSLVLGLVRSAVFEAALFSREGAAPSRFAWLMPRAGLAAGLGTAVVMGLVGFLTPDLPTGIVSATAAVGGATLLADGQRYAAIALGRPTAALVGDSVWLVGTVASTAIAAGVGGALTFESLAWCYAGSAVVGGLAIWTSIRRDLESAARGAPSELRSQSRFGADFVLQIVPGQAVLVIAPALIGLDGLGVYRAVVTLYQPLITAATAVRLAVLGGDEDARQLERNLARMIAVLVGLGVAYLAGALLVTQATSILDRGALVGVGAVLVGVYGLAEVARVGAQPLFDITRLRNRLRLVVRIRTVQAIVLVAGSIALGAWLGVDGYAVARLATYGSVVFFLRPLTERTVVGDIALTVDRRSPRSTS